MRLPVLGTDPRGSRSPRDGTGSAGAATRPGGAPALDFDITGADPPEYAAAPTIVFRLRITSDVAQLRSISLNTQLRVATALRAYGPRERINLAEVLGVAASGRGRAGAGPPPSLFWTQASVHVPAFQNQTEVDLPVTCTYDMDVALAKYFHGLEDGEVPLEMLFSGSVFYRDEDGFTRVARIPWDREARYRMPVAVWKTMMDRYFPGTAWLRIDRDLMERLRAYRAERALPTWDAALNALLAASDLATGAGPEFTTENTENTENGGAPRHPAPGMTRSFAGRFSPPAPARPAIPASSDHDEVHGGPARST